MNLQDNEQDWADLVDAVGLLTSPSVLIRISDAVGSTIEAGLKRLPKKAQEGIHAATVKGLQKSIDIASTTLESKRQEAWTKSHLLAVAATGAVGGFFGLPALLAEIPITTTVMMRSILDIARSEHHDLGDPRIRLECLSVFRHGSDQTAQDDSADTGYYASRSAMAEVISETAKALSKIAAEKTADKVVSTSAGQWLARLIDAIASRLGVVITEKAALQAAPILGAAAGATVNSVFLDHYQDTARGHFIVLRLESKYGEAAVKQAFQSIWNARDESRPKLKRR